MVTLGLSLAPVWGICTKTIRHAKTKLQTTHPTNECTNERELFCGDHHNHETAENSMGSTTTRIGNVLKNVVHNALHAKRSKRGGIAINTSQPLSSSIGNTSTSNIMSSFVCTFCHTPWQENPKEELPRCQTPTAHHCCEECFLKCWPRIRWVTLCMA